MPTNRPQDLGRERQAVDATAPAERRAASGRSPCAAEPAAASGQQTALTEHARTPAPGRSGSSETGGAQRGLELVALFVAPTTIVTALAFHFGWTLTNARASYFGIDASALGFSTRDYLLRSADALFVPLGTALTVALIAVAVHMRVARNLADPQRRPLLRRGARVVVVTGGALAALGIVAVFRPISFAPHYLFAPASPGVGMALLTYGLHLLARLNACEQRPSHEATLQWSRPLVITLVSLFVVLSAFWTASEYAEALGRGRAQRLAATLQARPQVTVFAPLRLHIAGDGVTERRLPADAAAYRYRYDGLRLLIRSAGKYFLLPNGWSARTGAVIVLPDSSTLRFEFRRGQ